ncbi:MAG: hypothetical protein KKH29_04360 [Candidatus Omnitrophica bacterium]|nr:hypothetical protein [Candidatus Omnitrophota bacterium]MBU4472711.1 hypothetical protein [Candidatus Omnitrophota bacterium]MCG2706404.1 hypothetical protein [Candidatus Omnitrophota bacterium]
MKDIRARSYVAIMVSIAIAALILRITAKQIITVNISQNESGALTTLKLISAALESYAKGNNNIFPSGLSVLVQTAPRYLDKDYISESPIKGYNYNCSTLQPSVYSCSAIPVKCNVSAKKVYTVNTGGLLLSEECSKKD